MPGENNANTMNNTAEQSNNLAGVSAKLGGTALKTVIGEQSEVVIIGYTKDGMAAHDRPDSHFHWEGGMTKELFEDALSKVDTEGRESLKEIVEYDHPVGESTCVEVGPEDEIVYAVRKPRRGLSPLVKNREAIPCNSVVIILAKDKDAENMYTLKTSFIGENSPREPWDSGIVSDEEYVEAKEFWDKHALLYDENLIDREKTDAYNMMSDAEKMSEQMAIRTFYSGLFVDNNAVLANIQPQLKNVIPDMHVTTNFQPGGKEVRLDQVGTQAKITAIGYGNDGKNEGLLVKVEAEDPEIQAAIDVVPVPHITLSVADDAHPKDTDKLDFKPLEKPFEITGTYGIFGRKRGEEGKNTILSQELLKEAEKEVRI